MYIYPFIMINTSPAKQVVYVSNFKDLVSTPFHEDVNAVCWSRVLTGNFAEIVEKTELKENITAPTKQELCALELGEEGQLARDIILHDWHLLEAHGAAPLLNVIRCYDRDDTFSFFSTDVYSFHADHAAVPSDTFLCTYYGEPSELLPNAQAIQKILVPEIREQLKKLYDGPATGFDAFLQEHFFDLHYQAVPDATPVSLGIGNVWRLSNDYPGCTVPPCIHRAPEEKKGQPRLLMIC